MTLECSRCGGYHMRLECHLKPVEINNESAEGRAAIIVWNSAIEAAIKCALVQNVPQYFIAEQIRKLKK